VTSLHRSGMAGEAAPLLLVLLPPLMTMVMVAMVVVVATVAELPLSPCHVPHWLPLIEMCHDLCQAPHAHPDCAASRRAFHPTPSRQHPGRQHVGQWIGRNWLEQRSACDG